MKDFSTSLLREKFTIRDAVSAEKQNRDSPPVVAVANRIVLPMANHLGNISETLVVRAHTMHGCLRMAARVAQEFQDLGPVTNRPVPPHWEDVWMSINRGYEEKFNADRWVSIYHKGRVIFDGGPVGHHPFLDIIEQCDARNQGSYEDSVSVAEDAFKQAGRLVTIEHDSNVALVLSTESGGIRCGVIVRTPHRTTTFSLTARPKAGQNPHISQCLAASATFLEGIHLAFQMGMLRHKQLQDVQTSTTTLGTIHEAKERMDILNEEIKQFESTLEVSYRPERPNFSKIIESAQTFARRELVGKKD